MATTLTNPFTGVWSRSYIRFDEGPLETHQQVIWIQAARSFGDVRSVTLSGRLTPDRYRQLDWRQQFDVSLLGFAGDFSWEPLANQRTRCTWHHTLSLLPGGFADSSDCTWLTPNCFVERGCYEDNAGWQHTFEERWQRLSPGPVRVWQLHSTQEQGLCLIADQWTLLLHDWRLSQTSDADPLTTLSAFSATCWQQRDQTWVLCFGTTPLLHSPSPWTPDRILSPEGLEFWHRQTK
jgi:hypothetical protein